MPKKFKGENSKAVEARARRDAQKYAEQEKKQKEAEDELWRDDDKHVARKQQRKEDKEKKRLEQVEKKKELQQLHDEEMSKLKSAKPVAAAKLTRAEIAAQQERLQAAAAAAEKQEKELVHDEKPLEENINRLDVEGQEARTVEEAISLLSIKQEKLERHPEKRVKAAYTDFEAEHLPRLKQENPNLRLSQLKQMLKKEWQKSPDNPLNQRSISYNSK
ncbi:coiled-coil domain-containing protein 124-like [Haliotis rubra]|uniref:coiled-coil domain-containing protein 124-like n=1 Tax=Haliotis rubra TaxID=36100 RepID=UPI001EE55BD3|nr:coiled-coil domain-containing protein 124-like [Haliotis rubra]XP_046574388.1 coiled-coil domain-containing protein 124-like [Haliotis rubra]